MRPYQFENTIWIDLDHVLAIEPSQTHMVVKLEMAFREKPLWLNYRQDGSVDALFAAWTEPARRTG